MADLPKETSRPSPPRAIKQRRGFALLSPERRAEISAMGGAAVPAKMRAFTTNRSLATAAGRKGGKASRGGGRSPAKP